MDGSLYSSSIDEEGNEKIHHLFYPEELFIVFNSESYYLEQPSDVSIKCYQDCALLVMGLQEARNLYDRFPRLFQFERMIIAKNFNNAVRKIKISPNGALQICISLLFTRWTRNE